MIRELRCGFKKHGELDTDEARFIVKCNSRLCGAAPGTIVLHTFDATSGDLLSTRLYKEIGARHGT